MFGKTASEPGNTAQDKNITAQGAYVNAKLNIGPAWVGGRFAYYSGDDPTTNDTEGGVNKTYGYGTDTDIWGQVTPALLFSGYSGGVTTFYTLVGDPTNTVTPGVPDNLWLYSIYGGVQATSKLKFDAKFYIMKADQDGKAPVGSTVWQSKNYGNELDVKGTYSIYDNLTYNVGVAYLWTGDWFKGTNPTASISNTYMIEHWIDLFF